MLEWLLAPLDMARPHDVSGALAWHARLMTLAWGFLVPLGILSARYLKLWPGQKWPEELDHPGWWHLHRFCQYLAGALTLVALWLILNRVGRSGHLTPHTVIGWAVVVLGVLQFASAWLRGSKGGPTSPAPDGSWHGDHYDMTPRRLAFEYIHKFGGYLLAFLACAAIGLGLWQANAPRWMAIVIGLWWLLCVLAGVHWQRRGRAFDTYQAHWGTDRKHPGNLREPIGFGIQRLEPTSADQK